MPVARGAQVGQFPNLAASRERNLSRLFDGGESQGSEGSST